MINSLFFTEKELSVYPKFILQEWLLAIIHDVLHVEVILFWINTKITGISDELNPSLSATVIVVLIFRC